MAATRKQIWEGLVRCETVRDREALERYRAHAKDALNHEMDLAIPHGLDFAYRVIWELDGMPGWDRDKP